MANHGTGLDQVRSEIDRIDAQMVALIAARQQQVDRAGELKGSVADVPAPERVEAVIQKVRILASEHGADPAIVETIYRTMIDAFIQRELDQVRQRNTGEHA